MAMEMRSSTEVPAGTLQVHPVAALSLGLSLAGYVFLPIVGALGGIIAGIIALDAIAAAPERYGYRGLAQAGIALGILYFVVGALAVVAAVLYLTPVLS